MAVGKNVECVFELQAELSIFLQKHNADLASLPADEIWLRKLAYLAAGFQPGGNRAITPKISKIF